jgi:enamine deaminase RidA (YjgF/YER057c/UK114 family)
MAGKVTHLDPEGLYASPLFTQVVVTTHDDGLKTIRVAGQAPIDAEGKVVGQGDLSAQASQVFANVEIAVEAAGGDIGAVIDWTFYLVNGQSILPVVEAYQEIWAGRPNPPMITTLYVSALAHPDYLFEAVTVAEVPEG